MSIRVAIVGLLFALAGCGGGSGGSSGVIVANGTFFLGVAGTPSEGVSIEVLETGERVVTDEMGQV